MSGVHLAHYVEELAFDIWQNIFIFWHISVEIFLRDIKNYHIYYFVFINDEYFEQGFQLNGWCGCVFFSYVLSQGSYICTRPPFLVFWSIFLLLRVFLSVLLSSVILWGCRGLVPPLLSCIPFACIPYTWRPPNSLSMILDAHLGCHLCEFHIHG